MANLLDYIPRTPLLKGVDYWPKAAKREEWFALTRDLIASTIAQMDLPPQEQAQVEEAFISAGLL